MVIKRVSESDDRAGQFINEAFTDYAIKSRVDLNFEEYCFAAENDEGLGKMIRSTQIINTGRVMAGLMIKDLGRIMLIVNNTV